MSQTRHPDIPVVDVAPLVRGEVCRATSDALREASQDPGFIYIENHGIDTKIINAARSSASTFFSSTESRKTGVSVSRHHRGWLRAGQAKMADDIPADYKESYIWGRSFDASAPSDHPLRGPNQWPDLDGFQRNAMAWFDHAERLAIDLLRGIATSLDLTPGFFLQHVDKPLSRASFVHYARRTTTGDGRFGVGPHTDFGVLTILCQDDVGGLQIETPTGDWIDAPPIEGTLIVNVGDLLARWTNGAFRSAPHRVVSPTRVDRLSLVLAFDPNPETLIDGRNVSAGGTPVEPITCGDYLALRFEQAFAYRRTANP